MPALLKIEHLTKMFPGQVALDDVDIEIGAGTTHALVGQNGSGKSTLIKILAGYHQPTGDAAVATYFGNDPTGEPLELGDGRAAERDGLRFVHQDLGLVDSLSAVENLAIVNGFTRKGVRIDWRTDRRRAQAALDDIGFGSVDVRLPVGALAPAQKTGVALARALMGWEHDAHLLVLDEPTASLPASDVEHLFEAIRRLKARGVAILYVSHHLDEVFEIADEVTVLRDGRRVTTMAVAELDHDRLIELMIGHKVVQGRSALHPNPAGTVVLQARALRGGNIAHVDLDVRAGEVVGIAGITGSGREHVVPLISGQQPSSDGEVWVNGRAVDNYSPHDLLEAGGAFVTADRKTHGVFPLMSVIENTTICDVGRNARGGRLQRKAERSDASFWIDRLAVKTASGDAPIATLSGGNQQKVIFARGLRLEPTVLLLDEPTQGIDVGAKEEIHGLIDELASQGNGVVVASTDTDELVRVATRVLIMRNGVVTAELAGDDIDSVAIERAQLAVAAGPRAETPDSLAEGEQHTT
jgi:ribose transport system ATP-binding protein